MILPSVANMLIVSLVFRILIALSCITSTKAAHSRKRAVVYARAADKYDRAISTFDSSGRLLQVDYGRNAASRGSSILAFIHEYKNVTADIETNGSTASSMESIYVLVASPSSFKVHRIDHHVFILTSGLAGDGRFLAEHLRQHCQSLRQAYGHAPSIYQVAQRAARLQHYLTRTAGARPLGTTAMIIGFDENQHDENSAALTARIYRTDPGGILEDCKYFVSGQHQDAILRMLPEAMDTNDATGDCQFDVIAKLIQTMAKASAAFAEKINPLALDVWMLQRNSSCRGTLQTTCLLNVKADDAAGMSRLKSHLTTNA
ncbi:hypothetical protein MPSEU_000883000 [Mayamaea pseudoterrestris]|nr:hypothetical protein MPSEU_000883000 [Mayamaea pseudoterrestris]